MKQVLTVLFSAIVFFLFGCVSVDKTNGTYAAHFLGQKITGGYTYHSGVTIINETTSLRMEAFVSQTRAHYKGEIGQNLFLDTWGFTNAQNQMTVVVSFFDESGTLIGKDSRTFYISYYNGAWSDEWYPRPHIYTAQIDPNRMAQ